MSHRIPFSLTLLLVGASLGACASQGWERLKGEFPQVQGRCGLPGTFLERDSRDRRLLHLGFRHRNNEAAEARHDGRLACAEHWALKRGWRLTTAPDGEGTR